MSFLDNILQGGSTGIATALATNGEAGPVDVSGSDTPNTGDVLTAMSGTEARWLPPGDGGGGSTPTLVTKLVYPTTEAEAEIHASAGTAYLIYIEIPLTGTLPRVWLPDATDPEVAGQTIRVTFYQSAPTSSLALEVPSLDGLTGNTFHFSGEFVSGASISNLERGTYTCVAVHDSTSAVFPNLGIWVVTLSPDTYLRRDQDIAYAMPGPIPDDAVVTFDPEDTAELWPIFSSDGTPLPFDKPASGSIDYGVDDLILVHVTSEAWEDYPGIYRVIASGASWVIQRTQRGQATLSGTGSFPKYRVRGGSIYGGRHFELKSSEDFQLANDDALTVYPLDGSSLDGTSDPQGAFTMGHVVFGKLNLFEVIDSDITLTIALQTAGAMDPALYEGARIALKCTGADVTDTLLINAPTGMQVEGPDGVIGATATFLVRTGAYVEWVLVAGAWLLVHYRVYTGV